MQLRDLLAARRRPGTPGQSFAVNAAHGRFQRVMALVAASFAILTGGEAYFEHMRGSFQRRVMWTPVWITPPMVDAAGTHRDAAGGRPVHREHVEASDPPAGAHR